MTRYNLKNKVTVVTGAAQGIGLAIAEQFLEKGAQIVVILDINEDGAETAMRLNTKYGPNKAVYIKCDVTKDLEAVSEHIFNMYKRIDILVNNAGIGGECVRKIMDINTIATMEWSLRFLEYMREKNNGGTIINISSIFGYRINELIPVYSASKFAVIGFSKSLGHLINFNRYGVRVIVVCPGLTETEINNPKQINSIGWEQWMTFISKCILQKPEAVGKAVAEVYEMAESGTAWVIEESKPIAPVP